MDVRNPIKPSFEADPVSCPNLERVLGGLLEISHFVGSVMLLDDILAHIVRITGDLLGVPVCSIYLFDEERKRLVLRSNVGFEPELIGQVGFDLGQGIAGLVARDGEAIALADANVDPRYAPLPSTLELGCRAYLCVPLRIQEEIIGVMTARRKDVHVFSQDEILFFETVGKQVAIVIEKARIYEQKIQAERLAAVAVSLTGVAHHIKNVLLTMQGGEYLVEQGLLRHDVERAAEGWDVLKRANRKIRGLVENILNYCRKSEVRTHPVDMNRMVGEMLQSLGDLARERGVSLSAELDENLGDIWIDPESFYDALLNLLSNGIEAIPEGREGHLTVRTKRLENRNQVRIDIIDDGPGVPEEIRDKIFNLFFSTKGQKGTGIGLAATRKIIEDHGGSIELRSTDGGGAGEAGGAGEGNPPGDGHPSGNGGAHFAVYLPVKPPDRNIAALQ
ncbi:MAG: ATP-binding protein [bacterium]|nr:ATP-binding protein [bacterium]